MMDQLLERDPGGAPAEILAEAIEQHMGGAGLDDSTLDDTHHDSRVSCFTCIKLTILSYRTRSSFHGKLCSLFS